jgi:hypothetical protein
MAVRKRKRLLIDAKVQGALVYRVVTYWVACVVTIELLNLTWQIATGPEQPTFADYFLHQDLRALCGRLALSGLLLAPITLDVLRLSNRFAGPVYRMQLMLHHVARGGEVEPVRLREDDFWQGFAAELNAALARLANQAEEHHGTVENKERPFEQPRLQGDLRLQTPIALSDRDDPVTVNGPASGCGG